MIAPLHEWVSIIQNPDNLLMAHHTGRGVVEDRFGSESNACAAVHAIICRMRGVKTDVWNTTSDAITGLTKHYYKRFSDWREIEPGDSLFSMDIKPKNGRPDHVCLAVDFPDPETGKCLVFDNYSPIPYPRNMVEGKYTPFAFGLRHKVDGWSVLSPYELFVTKIGFKLLYRNFSTFPGYIQEAINKLRHDPYFGNLT